MAGHVEVAEANVLSERSESKGSSSVGQQVSTMPVFALFARADVFVYPALRGLAHCGELFPPLA